MKMIWRTKYHCY